MDLLNYQLLRMLLICKRQELTNQMLLLASVKCVAPESKELYVAAITKSAELQKKIERIEANLQTIGDIVKLNEALAYLLA